MLSQSQSPEMSGQFVARRPTPHGGVRKNKYLPVIFECFALELSRGNSARGEFSLS